MKHLAIIGVVVTIFSMVLIEANDHEQMMRKSIIFNKKTPDVFYCPHQKPKGMDKLYVHAKPLKKLCEYEGKPLPAGYISDCYRDMDESEFACNEKRRIMLRLHPPGSIESNNTQNAEIKKVKKVIKKKKNQD